MSKAYLSWCEGKNFQTVLKEERTVEFPFSSSIRTEKESRDED